MAMNWLDPLDPEEEKRVVERVGGYLHRKGMETPGILFLEMHRPFSYIGSHMLTAVAPFVAPILGTEQTMDFSRLMATPGGVERLIQKLEETRLEKSATPE
jgi:hypothetical protein